MLTPKKVPVCKTQTAVISASGLCGLIRTGPIYIRNVYSMGVLILNNSLVRNLKPVQCVTVSLTKLHASFSGYQWKRLLSSVGFRIRFRIVTYHWQNSYRTPLYVACAYCHWCHIVNSPAKFHYAMSSLGSKTRGNEVTRSSKFN